MKSSVHRYATTNEQGAFSCEIYSRRSGLGVGYYHPDFMRHMPEQTREAAIPLAQAAAKIISFAETDEVMSNLDEGRSALVRGDLGSGKSQTINDVRFRLRTSGTPHAYVDMHNGLSPTRLEAVTKWAHRTGGLVVADSFDYVGAFCGRTRSKNPSRVEHNAEAIVGIMDRALAAGVRTVLTTHTEPWLAKHAKSDVFLEALSRWGMSGQMPTTRVYGVVEQSKVEETVDKIRAANDVQANLSSVEYAGLTLETPNPSLRQYRVMKLLLGSYELVEMARGGEANRAVEIIDASSRQKVGAPGDYSFMPPEHVAVVTSMDIVAPWTPELLIA